MRSIMIYQFWLISENRGHHLLEKLSVQKRKRLDVIHGADIHQPADRNPKYSLPARKSAAQRKALCDRLCANTGEYLSMKNDEIGDENREPTALMSYSELRTQYPLGSYATSENLTTGFDYDGQTTDL